MIANPILITRSALLTKPDNKQRTRSAVDDNIKSTVNPMHLTFVPVTIAALLQDRYPVNLLLTFTVVYVGSFLHCCLEMEI
jgi:hypothetical protein